MVFAAATPGGPDSYTRWKITFIAVESSLKQDGPIASPINSGTSRLLQFSIDADGRPSKQLHEYLYITDPVPQVSKFGINDNGVSEVPR